MKTHSTVPFMGFCLLVALLVNISAAEPGMQSVPFSQLGAKATADYHGNALGIQATAQGAKLHTAFQKLDGIVTSEGLWLDSTTEEAGRLHLTASAIGRESISHQTPVIMPLAPTGTVTITGQIVTFSRPGLTEEYSVSADGVRQDFIVAQRPAGSGELRLELSLDGATAETSSTGAKLTLTSSGRALAYSRLHVTDAVGRELPAHLQALSPECLTIQIDDTDAIYPVRIDPTFSDANWESLNSGFPGTDGGWIWAVAVDSSGNVYVGGDFTIIGTVTAHGIAKWNGSSWSALGSGVGGFTTPAVYSLALSGSTLYAGGRFTTVGGVAANYVAKWDGTTWSSLGTGMNDTVTALAISGTDLYAGGYFVTAGGSTTNCIAKWNGSSWSALGSGMDGVLPKSSVRALVVNGSDLYAGGSFLRAGGITVNYVAKWNGSIWSGLGSGMNNDVNALAMIGNEIYAGGRFTLANGTTANRIAKWNGSSWSALGSGLNSTVNTLAADGSSVYAGGLFTSSDGNHIAKWDGSNWGLLNGGTLNGEVMSMAVFGNALYAGGRFTTAGSVTASRIAKWSGPFTFSRKWSALGSGMLGSVTALAIDGTDLYVGGSFISAGTEKANHIAKWNGIGWIALGTGVDNDVLALVFSGGTLYVGGTFTNAGGSSANYIAKWDGSAWSSLGAGVNNPVHSLTLFGGEIYAGGEFTTAGGLSAIRIAKWNGSAWSSLSSGINGTVLALAGLGSDLFAAGQFSSAGGVSASNIAKWNGIAWSALGSGIAGGTAFPVVEALAANGTDLFVGGYFGTAGGVSANNIARWNGSSWSALGSGFNGSVKALVATSTALFAGGMFTNAGGVSANQVAHWDGSAWSALGSGINPSGEASALVLSGPALYVGGTFTFAGTTLSPSIALAYIDGRAPEIAVEQPVGTDLQTGTSTNDFGVVPVGTRKSHNFTVRNLGNGNLHLSSVLLTGGDSVGEYSKDTAYPTSFTISGGGSLMLGITFSPQTSGVKTTTLRFINDDTDEAAFDIALTGQGIIPGVVAFQNTLTFVNEESGTALIPLVRSGGSEGGVSVKISSTPVTAIASDFNPLADVVMSFADGQTTATVPVTITADTLAESNEAFILTLSDPQGGVALGQPEAMTVRIIDTTDTTKPTTTVTAPSMSASLNEGAVVNVTGSASDNKGVRKVQFSLNGAGFTDAVTTLNAAGTSATYTAPLSLVPGPNTVAVKSIDTRGNESVVVSRVLNSIVIRPLVVNKSGTGTLTAPFPGTDATKRVGFPYTLKATPGTGQVFNGWSVNNATGTGITPAMQELPTLTFIHQEGLVLRANFIPNPFMPAIIGKFNGLVQPSTSVPGGGTLASHETVGHFFASVTGTGSFTGTLKIDGLALPVTGIFDNTGIARFGEARATSVTLARTNKPGLEVALALDMTGSTSKLTGTVVQRFRSAVTAQSDIDADRAFYSATNKAPVALAGTVSRAWTMVFRHQVSQPDLTSADYPQGDGYATGTVKVDGAVSFTGKLADHTVITAASALSKTNAWPLYAALYAGKGSFASQVALTATSSTDAVLLGSAVRWFRPYQTVQWYPWGWPQGIDVDVIGASYQGPPQMLWAGLNPNNNVYGNVAVTFRVGQLIATVNKTANFFPTSAAKVPTADATWTFACVPATGSMSGIFTHSNGTKPAWQGVLLQHGPNQGGYGYFMTAAPKVIDGLGESGRVEMTKK